MFSWYFIIYYVGKVTVVHVHHMKACRLPGGERSPSYTFEVRTLQIIEQGAEVWGSRIVLGDLDSWKTSAVARIELRIAHPIAWPQYQLSYHGSCITILAVWTIFKRICKIAKNNHQLLHVRLSVCPHATGSYFTGFREILYWHFFETISKKIHVLLKCDKNNSIRTWIYIFDNSLSLSYNEKCIGEKV
jgi:hypothetical protein